MKRKTTLRNIRPNELITENYSSKNDRAHL